MVTHQSVLRYHIHYFIWRNRGKAVSNQLIYDFVDSCCSWDAEDLLPENRNRPTSPYSWVRNIRNVLTRDVPKGILNRPQDGEYIWNEQQDKPVKWSYITAEAIDNLNGEAPNPKLYEEVERLRIRDFTDSWKMTVQGTIERHSRDSEAWGGNYDVFYSVQGMGNGIWGLRSQYRINNGVLEDFVPLENSVWSLIQAIAKRYIREGIIFTSHRQETPYEVFEVNVDAITIRRLNGGENVQVSQKMFVDKAKLVEENSPVHDKEISTTTAVKTAIIELHPYLSYQDDLQVRYRRRKTSSVAPIDTYLEKTESKEDFDISSIEEARERIIRAINVRRGQGKFRRELMNAYEGKCCITGCDTKEVIEAAHIIPYRGEMTNDVRNGLILRADLHTLFDRCMIWIDTNTWSLVIDPELTASQYSKLADVKIRLPTDRQKWPSIDALNQHMDLCNPSYD